MFNKSLTIVLPVHNAESRLRKNVGELLELASELTTKFGVLIIDDGSTDATFEVAEELAARFPQVSVKRHRHCRGLGAAMDYVERRVRSDAVIVHDGVSPINSQNVRKLWRQWAERSESGAEAKRLPAHLMNDTSDFVNLAALQAAMEQAHRQVIGFQLLTPDLSESTSAADDRQAENPATNATRAAGRAGLGRIPTLPRPKFLSALAEFALGE